MRASAQKLCFLSCQACGIGACAWPSYHPHTAKPAEKAAAEAVDATTPSAVSGHPRAPKKAPDPRTVRPRTRGRTYAKKVFFGLGFWSSVYTKVRCILDAPLGFCSFQYTPILASGNVFLFFDRRPGWKRPWATPGPTLPQPPPPKKAPLSKSAFPPFPPLTLPGRRIYPWPLPRPFPRLHHRTTPVSLFVSPAWRPSSIDHHV